QARHGIRDLQIVVSKIDLSVSRAPIQLVDGQVMQADVDGQLSRLVTDISDFHQYAAAELTLDIKRILMRVWQRAVEIIDRHSLAEKAGRAVSTSNRGEQSAAGQQSEGIGQRNRGRQVVH